MLKVMKRPFVFLLATILLIGGIFALWQFLYATKSNAGQYVLAPLPELPKRDTPPPKRPASATNTPPIPTGPEQLEPQPLATYLEITTGCSVSLGPTCERAYARPASTSAVKSQLRIGSVLYVKGTITGEDGQPWYEIDFPEAIRYPDRLSLPWYVPATAGTIIRTRGAEELTDTTPTSTKQLIADRSDQKLYAYEGDTLVRTYTVSTGRELTPTPRGTFRIFRKTPSRYMQGPIPGISANYYDLPGVPWNLYFTQQGAVVHGAYWHESFGRPYSNGCVNVDPKEARALYDWADLGMTIVVRD
jgi:lipoprotein-anchoring transpeptidase ErfK/SrfK